MTFGVEITDNKALALVKQLEELKILRIFPITDAPPVYADNAANGLISENPLQEKEVFGPKQQAELMTLSGSLNMDPERFKEYEKFLNEIRNEWE